MGDIALLKRVRWALNTANQEGLDARGFDPSFLRSMESAILQGKDLTDAQVKGVENVIKFVDKVTFDNWEEEFNKEQSYYMWGND